MKKILLIIFLFIFCVVKVDAQEMHFVSGEDLDGIYYYKYDGKLYHFKYGKVIRDTETNEIAYCIQPFETVTNETIYTGSSDYDSNFGIDKDMFERLKLLSYYGYGYKNHTDKKWISITQMVIWRTLHPNLAFEWVDNLNSRNVIRPYDDEIQELLELVNNHYTLPSISSENELTLGLGEVLMLEDSNRVLKNYEIKSSDFDITLEDNLLIINSGNEVKEGTITFERAANNSNDSVMYFYSSVSQNVIRRGNIEPITFSINLNVIGGSIKINKVDSETKTNKAQGNGSLIGTVYRLYDEGMSFVDEQSIDDNGLTFTNLRFGRYFIKESQPGIGYLLDEEIHEVYLYKDNPDIEITLENEVKKAKIKIIKLYGTKEDFENDNMQREANVKFELYEKTADMKYVIETDENGYAEIIVPYGTYFITQLTTTEGYEKEDEKIVYIEEDTEEVELVLNDIKKEEPPKEEPPKEEPPKEEPSKEEPPKEEPPKEEPPKEEPPKEEPPKEEPVEEIPIVPMKVEVPNANYSIIKILRNLIMKIFNICNKDYNEINNVYPSKNNVENILMTIEIPSLNINNNIYNKDSKENNIDKNVIILNESSMPDEKYGMTLIGAHSGTGKYAYFKNLNQLEIGDEVILNYNGEKYTYIICDKHLDDKDGSIIFNKINNTKLLYLYTCNPNDKNNYLVITCKEK